MNLNQNLSGRKALVIVAHPDDETIWLGGLILRHPEMDWTIFALCRAADPDRKPKFLKACRRLKAKPIITNLADEPEINLTNYAPAIKKIISQKITNKKFDFVFTHGRNGEYGHPGHIATHQAVSSLVKENRLKTKTLFCFNYKNRPRPSALASSDLIIHLTAEEFKNKKAIMTEIYGFDPTGIDVNYCTNPEAFKIIYQQNLRD